MLEFEVVERAAIAPYSCVATGESSGPMVDTHRELHGIGRIYLSRGATVRAARAFGLVKGGPRHDELLDADRHLAERDAQIKALEAKVQELSDLAKAQVAELEEAQRYREWAVGRIAQLSEAVREDAEAKLAMVGDAELLRAAEELGVDLSAGGRS